MPQRFSLALKASKNIHAQSLIIGLASKGRLGNAIVDLYTKCGDIRLAENAFMLLEYNDTLVWNSMLSMYSRKGLLKNVIEGFSRMISNGVKFNQFSYAIVLSVCGKTSNVDLGKKVHSRVVKTGFEFDSFCNGALIDMYAKGGCLDDAQRIFNAAEEPDTVSWTAMISGYVQVGLLEKAMEVFEEMQELGHVPDQVALVTVINICVKLGRHNYAWRLFSLMPSPNVVAWNVMISGLAKGDHEAEAIEIFQNMTRAGAKPNRSTLGSVLSAIAAVGNLGYGLQVQARAVKQGLDSNVYVGSSLINMFAKCQKMDAAKKVFDSLDEKNSVLWNSLLGGYAQNGYAYEVVELFSSMRDCGFQPDEYTYTSVLSACACMENLRTGRELHSVIIKNKFDENLYVGNALVDMYAKAGALDDARQQFELLCDRDHISWNAIIVGYTQQEQEEEAFNMFRRMMSEESRPDEVSLASILSACANVYSLSKGKEIHCFLVKYGLETGLYAGGALIDMYSKCGVIVAATKVFSYMPERSVVSTNTLIAGYAETDIQNAVALFRSMIAEGMKPSEVTFASLLDACDDCTKLHLGRQMHCLIVKLGFSYSDEFLAVSLLGVYLNSQRKTDSSLLFSEFPDPKSRILWTAMVSGLTQNDCSQEALLWYQDMLQSGIMPDQATFASVLRACSILASAQDGRKIHCRIFCAGFDKDELICSALVDMYAKCGDVKSSSQIFDNMVTKNDVISWNSMIVGFAKNGYAQNALEIFEEMKRKSVKPDEITFLGVLTACSHAGMVSVGRQIYESMISSYRLQPRLDHCACMIDLLGRWGFLKEAEEFINNLDFEPDAMIWAAYLAACRLHGDDKRGQRAAERLIELEPQNSSPYVLLSNIYASTGNWEGVNSVRKEMKEKGISKSPGCSWIVLGQKTHAFVAGDRLHPRADLIHSALEDLIAVMKDKGQVAETEPLVYCEGT